MILFYLQKMLDQTFFDFDSRAYLNSYKIIYSLQFKLEMRGIFMWVMMALMWSCLTQNFSQYCNITDSPSVVIGNQAIICARVTVKSANTYYYLSLKIDQYSVIKLNGVAQLINTQISNNPNFTCVVQLMFQNSPSKVKDITFYDGSQNIQTMLASVIIQTDAGSITQIVTDSTCDGTCSICFNNICYDKTSTTYGNKDPAIYISWVGSDSDKKQYLSSAQRISRFTQYSVTSVYNQARDALSK